MTEPHGIIYLATSPSGKSYVGQTTRSLKSRWGEHVYDAAHRGAEYPMARALRKYPAEQWSVVVASRAASQKQLDAQEDFLISMFGDYNVALRARGPGRASPETRAKMSAARTGLKPTDETRAKLSAALKGRPWSESRRADRKGRKLSDEHKAKIGDASRGRKVSPETKARMSAAQTDRFTRERASKRGDSR